MKTVLAKKTMGLVIGGMLALPVLAGPSVGVEINVPAPVPPAVVVPAPPAVTVTVPDSYVWDGYEYVGVVGSQYYYLGPDNAWMTMDAPRLARWHEWAGHHSDWRTHATRNEKYRSAVRHEDAARHDEHHDADRDHHDDHH